MNLNHAFALEDETIQVVETLPADVLFEDPKLGEIPELNEDLQLIAALETEFINLSDLLRDMRAQGGMSQALALEADAVIPGFLNIDRPLGMYTKFPSMTQYRMALEEFDAKRWGVVGAIVATALAVIYKIFTWMTGNKDSKKDGEGPLTDKALAKAEDRAGTNEAKAEKIKEAVADADKSLPSEVKVEELAKQVVKENEDSHVGKTTTGMSALDYDILTSGASSNNELLTRNLMLAVQEMGRQLPIFEHAINDFSKVVDTDIFSIHSIDEMRNTAYFKKYRDSKDSLLKEPLLITYRGTARPIQEVTKIFTETYARLKSEKRTEITDFKTFLDRLTKLKSEGAVHTFRTTAESYHEVMVGFEHRLKELDAVVKRGQSSRVVTDEKGREVREEANITQEFLTDMQTIVRKLMGDALAIRALYDLAYRVFISDTDRIYRHAEMALGEITKKAKEAATEVPEEKASLIDEAVEALKRFTKP